MVPPSSPLYPLAVKALAAAVPALPKGSKGGKVSADMVPPSPSDARGSVGVGVCVGAVGREETSSGARRRCEEECGDEDEDEDENQSQERGQGQGQGQTVGGVWMPKIGEFLSPLQSLSQSLSLLQSLSQSLSLLQSLS